MARKATWQSHASPREHLRGAKVTHVCALYIYILFNYKYKHPDYRNSLTHKTALHFKRIKSFLFLRVGLCSLKFVSLQDTWRSVEHWIKACGLLHLDRVDAESTGSSINHVRFKWRSWWLTWRHVDSPWPPDEHPVDAMNWRASSSHDVDASQPSINDRMDAT